MPKYSKEFKKMWEEAGRPHKVWHKFRTFLTNAYGKDLFTDSGIVVGGIRTKNFNSTEWSRRMVGHDVMTRVERYVKRYCPEIKIMRVDDATASTSFLLFIPHPKYGITTLFIPQNTHEQNFMSLCPDNIREMQKILQEMKKEYNITNKACYGDD